MSIDWRQLYSNLLKENQDLKNEITLLETILKLHIPIVEKKDDE